LGFASVSCIAVFSPFDDNQGSTGVLSNSN
jgi:hypothetical protein